MAGIVGPLQSNGGREVLAPPPPGELTVRASRIGFGAAVLRAVQALARWCRLPSPRAPIRGAQPRAATRSSAF